MLPNSSDTLKKVGNTTNPKKRIWDEYVDEYGNSSLETHTPVEVWRGCDNHYFLPSDNNGNVQCRSCSFGQKIVWGYQKLENGKIIQLHK